MLRADNVICGTSTTGTGTLTLVACPAPPGGMDFDKWLKATGFNFVSGNAVLVSYTLIEYTDSTFATAKQTEKGIGTLTLGASISAATLARTLVQSTVTGLNATPAPSYSAATAITIGTAANTLVFVGPSSTDVMAFSPFVDATSANATGYIGPLSVQAGGSASACSVIQTSLTDYYIPFYWASAMLVKRIALQVQAAYTGGTSNLYARIYAPNSSGRPGKLLYDFGVVGTANSSLASTGAVVSGAAGNGFFLTPGVYFLDILASFSGGTGTPDLFGTTGLVIPSIMSADQGALVANALPMFSQATATGGTAGAAPDPANLTSYNVTISGSGRSPGFAFKAS